MSAASDTLVLVHTVAASDREFVALFMMLIALGIFFANVGGRK